MSLLSDAVESLLRDKEIRAALLDFLKGNTPDKRECWREIWRYIDTTKRAINDKEVMMVVVAEYCDERQVGYISAYTTRSENDYDFHMQWLVPIYTTSLIGSYTEVILHSQTDALTEARAAFALEVERLQNA